MQLAHYLHLPYNLEELAKFFHIENPKPHDSLGDILTTGFLIPKLYACQSYLWEQSFAIPK